MKDGERIPNVVECAEHLMNVFFFLARKSKTSHGVMVRRLALVEVAFTGAARVNEGF